MPVRIDKKFSTIVDQVAREIVTTEHLGSASLIKTPMMYPSGAHVVIQVAQHGERFFISDLGMGHQESEMFGGSNFYNKAGRDLAEMAGIRFDNQAFFVAESSKEQLAGAVVVVANCSAEATVLASHRAAEKKYADDADLLYKKLVMTFPKAEVSRDVTFAGSSTHVWPIAASVSHKERLTLFEPVTKNHSSVVSTHSKFTDIARLENPPRRIVVVRKKAEMADYINLLSQAGRVIDYDVPSDDLLRLAEAA